MEIGMDAQVQSRVVQAAQHLPFEVVALVLQGSGALGAYQAGVCDALSEAGIQPNWIAGMSIGAINAAIIAGNAPNDRVDRLREFWVQVTSDGPWPRQCMPRFHAGRRHASADQSDERRLCDGKWRQGILQGAPGATVGFSRPEQLMLPAFTTRAN
jgi:predicted acylesterase/phospholipase RssA